jgi:hypothetical protein
MPVQNGRERRSRRRGPRRRRSRRETLIVEPILRPFLV